MNARVHFFTLAVFLTGLSGCQTPASSPEDLTLRVDGGLISGTTLALDTQVRAYRGIPYAAPPVGDLRWKPPQPVENWQGLLEAHQFSYRLPPAPS